MVTRSKAADLERRKPQGDSVLADLLLRVDADLDASARPDPTLGADDPVGWMRTFLGFHGYDKQRDIARAVHSHDNVTVVSATKCGKTEIAAAIALWYVFTHIEARVILTAPKFAQVQHIAWRAVRLLHRRSGICVECRAAGIKVAPCQHSQVLGGKCHKQANSGLQLKEGNEILGLTAADADRMRGLSGRHVLFIVDEASAVSDEIADVLEASQSAGAKILLISNPSRRSGFHYEAHHAKRDFWRTIQISALDTPNSRGQPPIPGLATREYVERKRVERGADSSWFLCNVLGVWPTNDEGRTYAAALLDAARERWNSTEARGRLVIGIDPSFSERALSDETAIALRRGRKVIGLYAMPAMAIDQLVAKVVELVRMNRNGNEIPVVMIDATGLGSRVYHALCNHPRREFEAHAFEAFADPSPKRRKEVVKRRDEAFVVLRDWLKAGGALPNDPKLARELEVVETFYDKFDRAYYTSKKEFRAVIHRSPDRLDAVTMCCMVDPEANELRDREYERHYAAVRTPTADASRSALVFDPYGGFANTRDDD